MNKFLSSCSVLFLLVLSACTANTGSYLTEQDEARIMQMDEVCDMEAAARVSQCPGLIEYRVIDGMRVNCSDSFLNCEDELVLPGRWWGEYCGTSTYLFSNGLLDACKIELDAIYECMQSEAVAVACDWLTACGDAFVYFSDCKRNFTNTL